MKSFEVSIDEIYVPAGKRKAISPERVEALAADILEKGQVTPVQVRLGKERYVLIEGGHRIEALKALGEDIVIARLVQARKH
ncbi:ParB N-terminal domain-containing protein [Sneathiella chinensis]|nr:ParB N-terminal domain-containing protein [Sneathiella chinensis]